MGINFCPHSHIRVTLNPKYHLGCIARGKQISPVRLRFTAALLFLLVALISPYVLALYILFRVACGNSLTSETKIVTDHSVTFGKTRLASVGVPRVRKLHFVLKPITPTNFALCYKR